MYMCMHVCMYVLCMCMHVCMYVCTLGVVHSWTLGLVIWQQTNIDEHLVWRIGLGLP